MIIFQKNKLFEVAYPKKKQFSIIIVVFVIVVLLSECGFVQCCGDVGPESILEERDRLESPEANYFYVRSRRATSKNIERKACGKDNAENIPLIRVNTTTRLDGLRKELEKEGLDAFLVPSGDSHQSEYIAEADKRLKWISGFSGTGFAAVTKDSAALWTDGRYFIQAEDQLDCNWLFMTGQEGDLSKWIDWLGTQLPENAKIGADPTLTGAHKWISSWKPAVQKYHFELTPVSRNLIDKIWNDDSRKRNEDPLEILDTKFSGRRWQQKVEDLLESLDSSKSDAIILTALDEIAWLFNLRGKDIPYNPVFRAYAIIGNDKKDANLSDAQKPVVYIYLPNDKQDINVKHHLNSDSCGTENENLDGTLRIASGHSSNQKDSLCVRLKDYDQIFNNLPALIEKHNWNSILLGKNIAYSGGASYAIYNSIPPNKVTFDASPVMLMKAQKNKVEIENMKNANMRDVVAIMELATMLEDGLSRGEHWDELKASQVLEDLRKKQKYFKGLSFQTISAYKENGAIIHYKPNNITNKKIGRDSLLLLDSGGQYLDGTTDTTRTFHFGQPSDFEREAYTRVLMGSIDLARSTFIAEHGITDSRLDILARWNLYRVGLNYNHGTGHGIGAYGFIHESPIQVRVYSNEEHEMKAGYFFSDEPGYYEKGKFGIRLETVLMTVEKNDLKYGNKDVASGGGKQFLGFEPVALIPFEPKLIDFTLLNQEQIEWLNNYNKLIRHKIGKELRTQKKDKRIIDWLYKRTKEITPEFLRHERQKTR